ncbi:MAG: flagellar hook protein FlgE [Campylobacterales bacterium]|nr:flagellar hook protein FlgE [Campylobacterales bacterium]
MNSSFYNGIAGTKTHQFGIDVWADNIANVNTTGFKSSTPEFASLFATTLTHSYFGSSITSDIGYGSRAQSTAMNTTQGPFQNTDSVFDLALGGEGWFGVKGTGNQTYYTRAGSFSIDGMGNMVDANGNYLLGTVGNNYTPTTLPEEVMKDFGSYYGLNNNMLLAQIYAVTQLQDIPLGPVQQQGMITLPDYLYYPPIPTQNISYKGNLDPKIIIESVDITVNEDDVNTTLNTVSNTASITGNLTNTPEALTPKEGDLVSIVLTDHTGQTQKVSAYLDENLAWSLVGVDLGDLDISQPLTTVATLSTMQEVPNVETFSTSIISPSGEKDVLSMVFTKQIPQPASGSVWDGVMQVRTFYENYAREEYDPSVTYDPSQYEIHADMGYVIKIYDPAQFYVDKTANKVYQITDSQVGQLTFGGAGQLLESTIPAMSNSGAPLAIFLGTANNYDGLTSSTNFNTSRSYTQDGQVAGLLKGYGMDERGNVIAEFTNGRSVPMAKVAVYHFQNDQGLTRTTSSLFQASSNSGNPIFYTDADGNFVLGSQVFSNRLESSNVNLATALTELIVMQKAFSGNAKSITTSDEMIKNAIQMKR